MLWHEHLRRTAKIAILGGLHYSGLLAAMQRRVARDSAVILMYHRVTPRDSGVPDYSPSGMSVTPEEFAMQMRYISRHYSLIPLDKLVSLLNEGRKVPTASCVVTFDDGWRDVYDHAFPVLKAFDIPATIFLTTAYVGGGRWRWEERARYLMARLHQGRGELACEDRGRRTLARLAECELRGLTEVGESRLPGYILSAVRRLKGLDAAGRASVLELLEQASSTLPRREPRPFLNWEEVREMAQAGIGIGNHTMTHPSLPEIPDAEIVSEIEGADSELRRATGVQASDFAYPFGKYEARVEALVRRHGFASACTTRIGPVRAGDNVYALNRINIASEVASNEPLFAGRLMCL